MWGSGGEGGHVLGRGEVRCVKGRRAEEVID